MRKNSVKSAWLQKDKGFQTGGYLKLKSRYKNYWLAVSWVEVGERTPV